MSPPLISDYKIHFTIKRILQTFFGGPIFWIRPITLVIVQVLLFLVPVIELIVVRVLIKHRHHSRTNGGVNVSISSGHGQNNDTSTDTDDIISEVAENTHTSTNSSDGHSTRPLNYFRIGLIVGSTVLITDLVLTLLICALKATGRRDTKKVQPLALSESRRRSSTIEPQQHHPSDNNARHRQSIDRGHEPGQEPEHPAPSTFLAEEDHLEYKGLFHASTWNFIVPNICVPLRLSIGCVFRHFAHVLGSSIAFGLCSPLVLNKDFLTGFGMLALCTTRYSALFHTPFEIATFDTIHQGKHPCYRIFYVLIVGVCYAVASCINHAVPKFPFLAILACLPFLWSFGVLPPLDALFPWLIETILQLFGGATSFFYSGSFLCMFLVIGSSLLVLITDDYFTVSVIIQCIFGYMISCDMGIPRYFFKSSSSVCGLEAMPFNKCVSKLLPPTMQIIFSILFCYLGLALFQNDHVDDVPIIEQSDKWIVEIFLVSFLAAIVATVRIHQFYLQGIGRLGKFWASNSNGLLAAQRVLLRLLTASLHLLTTIELGKLDQTGNPSVGIDDFIFNLGATATPSSLTNETNGNSSTLEYEMLSPNSTEFTNTMQNLTSPTTWLKSADLEENTKSLIQLFMYAMTIRAFALSITHPRQTTIDMALAFGVKYGGFGVEQLHFPVILFAVSFPRKWAWRSLRGFGLFFRILYSTSATSLIDSKARTFAFTILFLPVTITSIILFAIFEGSTLTPLFTLPIFILGFPRPSSFWKQRWFPFKFTRSRSSQVIRSRAAYNNNLEYVIYEDVSSGMVQAFVRKIYASGDRLQCGQCFLARFDDRLIFLRVLTVTWNSVYLQVKGLEMQEQTSCHHHEAAWVDEIFDSIPFLKAVNERDPVEVAELKSASFLTYYIRRWMHGAYSTAKQVTVLRPLFKITLPTYTESKSGIEPLAGDSEKQVFRKMFFYAFTFLWIRALCRGQNKASNGHISLICSGVHLFDRRRSSNASYASSTTSGNGNGFSASHKPASAEDDGMQHQNTTSAIIAKFPYLPGMEPVAESRTSPGSLEPEPQTSAHTSSNATARPGTYTKNAQRNYSQSELEWIQYQVNDLTDEAEIRRIVKTAWKIWSMVTGAGSNDIMVNRVCLFHYFEDGFKTSVEQALKNFSNKAIDRVNAEVVVKSFRYAVKLTLDHLYSHGQEPDSGDNEPDHPQHFYEIASQIRAFERNTEFCTYKEVAEWVQKKQTRIITMTQPSNELTQLHIFNYHEVRSRHRPVFVPVEEGDTSAASSTADGVRISVGQLSSLVVDGIWSNLNLELLYLTSDDDERYSIQHDKILLRNICTQAASSPLGYFVYDSIFRVNLLDRFKIQQMQ